ncbi:MAG: hypothetical protein DRP57_04340 [Spirochaetes bacterium]|nr:MAG: hypothetical protein DRP57_04340 [Spirochaetota bacterium]
MKIWATDIPKKQRPIININDRALTMGKNQYLAHMIELKREDLKEYTKQKETMEETSATALLWYNFMKNKILGEEPCPTS